jgi:hypothetical protein
MTSMTTKTVSMVFGAALALAIAAVSEAPAATPKPPKTLCVKSSLSDTDVFVLQIKPVGPASTATAKVPLYTISGFTNYAGGMILAGGGAMSGNSFKASISGTQFGDRAHWGMAIVFDLVTDAATIRFSSHHIDGSAGFGNFDLLQIDCATVTISP